MNIKTKSLRTVQHIVTFQFIKMIGYKSSYSVQTLSFPSMEGQISGPYKGYQSHPRDSHMDWNDRECEHIRRNPDSAGRSYVAPDIPREISPNGLLDSILNIDGGAFVQRAFHSIKDREIEERRMNQGIKGDLTRHHETRISEIEEQRIELAVHSVMDQSGISFKQKVNSIDRKVDLKRYLKRKR